MKKVMVARFQELYKSKELKGYKVDEQKYIVDVNFSDNVTLQMGLREWQSCQKFIKGELDEKIKQVAETFAAEKRPKKS